MNKLYFEEFQTRVTADCPYAVFPRENINYIGHIHEEIEVACLLSGEVTATTEVGEIRMQAGDLCLFMPDEIHAFRSLTENRAYIIRILPKSGLPLNFSRIRLHRNLLLPGDRGYSAIWEASLQMAAEDQKKAFGYEIAMKKWMNEILLCITRELEYFFLKPEEKKKITSRSHLLRTVNEYIAEHYADPVSLDSIAERCNCSKYYFAHCVKELTGMSFLEFLTLYRLDKATDALRETDRSITDIAMSEGFNNLRSFHRMFRKYYRTTPSLYRKTSRTS